MKYKKGQKVKVTVKAEYFKNTIAADVYFWGAIKELGRGFFMMRILKAKFAGRFPEKAKVTFYVPLNNEHFFIQPIK